MISEFTYLTEDRVARALAKWEAETNSFSFQRSDDQGSAQIVFVEAGNISLLESIARQATGLCSFSRILGHACFDFTAFYFEKELEENDAVTVRIASSSIGDGASAFHTLVHEIGHALGIAHTPQVCPSCIMNSQLLSPLADLHQLDIAALHAHYQPAQPSGTKIAFYHGGDIYIMNVDGTGLDRLTDDLGNDLYPAWSPDGKKIAFMSTRDGSYGHIYVMNADGTGLVRLTDGPANDWEPAWSPDGKKIAFTSDRDGNNEIYVMNADGSKPVNLTNYTGHDGAAAWSPDGTKIAFQTSRPGKLDIYVMNSDGSGLVNLSKSPDVPDYAPAWSPDGTKIAFHTIRDANGDIYVMNADGTGLDRLTDDPANDWEPAWSPDGARIAFQTSRNAFWEIYLMNADGTEPVKLPNSPINAYAPAWSPSK